MADTNGPITGTRPNDFLQGFDETQLSPSAKNEYENLKTLVDSDYGIGADGFITKMPTDTQLTTIRELASDLRTKVALTGQPSIPSPNQTALDHFVHKISTMPKEKMNAFLSQVSVAVIMCELTASLIDLAIEQIIVSTKAAIENLKAKLDALKGEAAAILAAGAYESQQHELNAEKYVIEGAVALASAAGHVLGAINNIVALKSLQSDISAMKTAKPDSNEFKAAEAGMRLTEQKEKIFSSFLQVYEQSGASVKGFMSADVEKRLAGVDIAKSQVDKARLLCQKLGEIFEQMQKLFIDMGERPQDTIKSMIELAKSVAKTVSHAG